LLKTAAGLAELFKVVFFYETMSVFWFFIFKGGKGNFVNLVMAYFVRVVLIGITLSILVFEEKWRIREITGIIARVEFPLPF